MDLYSILWVERTCTKEEVKKSYRKLAMQYHPDRNGGDKEAENKFKEINMAYEILSDDDKRRQYDTFWTTSSNQNPFSWWFSGWVNVDLNDIFESFFSWWFGGNSSRRRTREFRWEDIELSINIDLKTSILWWKEKIKFNKKEACTACNQEWGTGKKTCSKCNWKWQVTYSSQSFFWVIQQTATCDECGGTWEVFEHICTECNWEKRVLIKKELEIDIPAGIDDNMVIKMTWEWNDWVGTKAKWDLFIRFNVELEEKWLKRDWTDLYYEIEIELVQAVLWVNKEINIPILGKRIIEIKAWIESGSIIKLAQDWVKYIDRDKKWDLFIKVNIKIPKKLSKKERELYEEIAKENKIEVNKKWVINKIFW